MKQSAKEAIQEINQSFENIKKVVDKINQWSNFKVPAPVMRCAYILDHIKGITDMNIPIQAIFNRVQNITTCIIILWPDEPSIQTNFSGIAVLNHADEQDNQDYANRLAFKRAARKAQEHFTIQSLCLVKAKDLYSWYRSQLRADNKEEKDE
jgi:hypothetical protein